MIDILSIKREAILKTKILIAFALTLCVFSVITLYQYYLEDLSDLEAARTASNSEFIKSDFGLTRYQVFGEDNAPTVILIHSFNGFIESWKPNIEALVKAGYRVVAYDLFGRGLSDRPNTKYDLSLFRNQLDLVIKEVGANKAHLVGSSFGCIIASDYANRYPERVESLVMVGPAGWPQEDGPSPLLGIPIVSDLAFHYFGESILRPTVEAYLLKPSKNSQVIREWARYAGYPGFTRAALSTLRNSPVLDYLAGWEQLAVLNKPTLFIWGKQDVSFPFSNSKMLDKLVPHAKVIGIDEAAHWVNIEKAELVNSNIVDFLNINGKQ